MSYYITLSNTLNHITSSINEKRKLLELIKWYYNHEDRYIGGINETCEMVNKYAFNFMKRVLGYITVGDIDTFYANQFKASDDEENKSKTINGTNYDNDYDKECMLIQIEKYDDGETCPLQNFGYEDDAQITSNEQWETFHNALADGLQSMLRKIKEKINIEYITQHDKDNEIEHLILLFFENMARDVELEITDDVNEISCERAYEYFAYIKNNYYEYVIKELKTENKNLIKQIGDTNNELTNIIHDLDETYEEEYYEEDN